MSQQLTSLEAALGARLIERSARQFCLTRAGALFVDPAKTLSDNIGAAKAKLVLADQAPPLNLRFGSIEELDATVTAPWLLKLADRFLKAALSLTGGASHESHDALSSPAVDMTLTVDTVAKVDWVERHPILLDPFIFVTAKGANLTNSPMIRYKLELAIGRQIEAQLRRTGPVPAWLCVFNQSSTVCHDCGTGWLGDYHRAGLSWHPWHPTGAIWSMQSHYISHDSRDVSNSTRGQARWVIYRVLLLVTFGLVLRIGS